MFRRIFTQVPKTRISTVISFPIRTSFLTLTPVQSRNYRGAKRNPKSPYWVRKESIEKASKEIEKEFEGVSEADIDRQYELAKAEVTYHDELGKYPMESHHAKLYVKHLLEDFRFQFESVPLHENTLIKFCSRVQTLEEALTYSPEELYDLLDDRDVFSFIITLRPEIQEALWSQVMGSSMPILMSMTPEDIREYAYEFNPFFTTNENKMMLVEKEQGFNYRDKRDDMSEHLKEYMRLTSERDLDQMAKKGEPSLNLSAEDEFDTGEGDVEDVDAVANEDPMVDDDDDNNNNNNDDDEDDGLLDLKNGADDFGPVDEEFEEPSGNSSAEQALDRLMSRKEKVLSELMNYYEPPEHLGDIVNSDDLIPQYAPYEEDIGGFDRMDQFFDDPDPELVNVDIAKMEEEMLINIKKDTLEKERYAEMTDKEFDQVQQQEQKAVENDLKEAGLTEYFPGEYLTDNNIHMDYWDGEEDWATNQQLVDNEVDTEAEQNHFYSFFQQVQSDSERSRRSPTFAEAAVSEFGVKDPLSIYPKEIDILMEGPLSTFVDGIELSQLSVGEKMWQLHKEDPHLWTGERLARLFGTSRAKAWGEVIVREKHEASESGRPFNYDKLHVIFQRERLEAMGFLKYRAQKTTRKGSRKGPILTYKTEKECYEDFLKDSMHEASFIGKSDDDLPDSVKLPFQPFREVESEPNLKSIPTIDNKLGLGTSLSKKRIIFITIGDGIKGYTNREFLVRDKNGTMRTANWKEIRFVTKHRTFEKKVYGMGGRKKRKEMFRRRLFE